MKFKNLHERTTKQQRGGGGGGRGIKTGIISELSVSAQAQINALFVVDVSDLFWSILLQQTTRRDMNVSLYLQRLT